MPYVFNPFTNTFDWTAPGVTDHSALSNLDYASSGHTGFQATLTFPLAANLGGTGVDNGVFNLTVPATGTAALLGIANVFTVNQKINVNSTTALLVEQDGVKDNTLIVDTTNGRVGVNIQPTVDLDIYKLNGNARLRILQSGAGNFTSALQVVCDDSDLFFGAADDSYTAVSEYTGKPFFQANGGEFAIVSQTNGIQFYTGGRALTNRHVTISSTGQLDIDCNSTTAFRVQQAGVQVNTFLVNTTSGLVSVGGTSTARFGIIGNSDIIQTIIKANSTQTANILEIQKSDATVYASINPVGGAVFNETGDAAGDLRAESDTEANMLFLDASADQLFIGGTTNGVRIDKGGVVNLLGTANIAGGATGTFTTVDLKTVTVTGGIITSIV